MRTLDEKLTTALDTYAWLKQLPVDEDTTLYRILLETLIADYSRIKNKQKINELHWYALVRAQALTAVLMDEHAEEHSEAIEGYVIDSVPENAEQLIQCVLLDALHQFTSSLTAGKRTKDYNPLTPETLTSILSK